MALTDLRTGHTRAFRACAINQGPDRSVTLLNQTTLLWICPIHGNSDCVETFHSESDLASVGWWDLYRMWRRWRQTNRLKEQP